MTMRLMGILFDTPRFSKNGTASGFTMFTLEASKMSIRSDNDYSVALKMYGDATSARLSSRRQAENRNSFVLSVAFLYV